MTKCDFYPYISGQDYADKHWKASNQKKVTIVQWCGHRVVALIQYIPIIGLLAKAVEKVAVRIFSKKAADSTVNSGIVNKPLKINEPSKIEEPKVKDEPKIDSKKKTTKFDENIDLVDFEWEKGDGDDWNPVDHITPKIQKKESDLPSTLPPMSQKVWTPGGRGTEVFNKALIKNMKKSIEERQKTNDGTFVTCEEVDLDIFNSQNTPSQSLKFTMSEHEEQGEYRETMEDAKFYVEKKAYVLTAVFDGHSGSATAKLANEKFPEFFEKHVNEGKTFPQALELTIAEIHELVSNNKIQDGSTAIVCCIDKKTNYVYTATVADSEANIYRKFNTETKSIPLSCMRNWSSPKDVLRAVHASDYLHEKEKEEKYDEFVNSTLNPKYLRYSNLNISRAIGDVLYKDIMTFKPKMTVFQLQPGDDLVLACDGIKDFTSEKEVIQQLESKGNRAEALVKCAGKKHNSWSNDNMTAIVIHCE